MRPRWFAVILFAALLWGCSDDSQPSAPASVDITFPIEGQIITNDRFRVEGTANNAASVEVNGITADVVGGEWQIVVPFDQGAVSVTATTQGASDTVNFTVDSIGPLITITSPERGFYAENESLTVSGTIEESGTGLQSVDIYGQTIDVDSNGGFEFDWPLQEGLNEIQVRARDNAGNETDALRGGMFGPTIDPTENVTQAFQIFVRQEAIDTVETVAESLVTPEFVTDFVKESLTFENVDIEAITFDPVDVELVPRMGRLDLEIYVTNANLEGSFTIGEETYPTTINVAEFKVTIEMRLQPAMDGTLDFSFGTAALDLAEEDLTFMIQDLTQADVEFLRDLVVDIARRSFGELLSETIFDQLYDPAIFNRRIEILGRVLVFEVRFEEISVFPDGILLNTSIRMPEEKFSEVREVPGALNRSTGNPNGPTTMNDIIFTSTHNALDRLLHGVWRSGLLHQDLRGDDFGGLELPIELTSDALALVLDPQINNLAPAGTQAGIVLRPLLPPVVEFDPEGAITMKLGEFMIDVVLFPDSGPVKVASVAFFLDLTVSIAIEGVVVNLSFDTELRADLDDEPQFDLDDEATEELLEGVVALVPSVLEQSIDLRGEADITWVKLQNPEIEVHGLQTDHVTVSLEMIANPEGLDPMTE